MAYNILPIDQFIDVFAWVT